MSKMLHSFNSSDENLSGKNKTNTKSKLSKIASAVKAAAFGLMISSST